MTIFQCRRCGKALETGEKTKFIVCKHCGAGQMLSASFNVDVENLVKCGNMALEFGRWNEAENFFERILAEDDKEPRAYLGKLMAQCRISNESKLLHFDSDVSENDNYEKAYRFADSKLKKRLEEYKCHTIYNMAQRLYWSENAEDVKAALGKFASIAGWKDAESRMEDCRGRIRDLMESPRFCTQNGRSPSLIIQKKHETL